MTAYNVISPELLVNLKPEDISIVLSNFQAISGVIDGHLDDSNIAENAHIQLSKLESFGDFGGVHFDNGDITTSGWIRSMDDIYARYDTNPVGIGNMGPAGQPGLTVQDATIYRTGVDALRFDGSFVCDNLQDKSEKGQPNGYAGLDSSGKVPGSQLPTGLDPAAFQLRSEEGQPNGYASLDASGFVPIAQLPYIGNDLVYRGDWVSGPDYRDGDIVVYNNVEYMCVRPTTGPPTAWPPNVLDLAPYQLKSEKTQPNGYPSLDATGKVPQAQLPPAASPLPPTVNGQFLKGVAGNPAWAAIAPADIAAGSSDVTKYLTSVYQGGTSYLAQFAAIAQNDLPTGLKTVAGALANNDWNDVGVNNTGFFSGNNAANAPTAGNFYGIQIYTSANNKVQIAVSLSTTAPVLYWRSKSGGTWSPWQVPGAGGASITYTGTYDPAHTYHDGDYVVGADGITYQCVKEGTVGVTPVPWAPAPTIPYGTSLPASPVDGMEAVLVDSVSNPTYQWRFRYNAGSSSAYKWEFVGGASVSAEVTTQESTTSTTFVDLTTVGPQVTVPRAGEYQISFGCRGWTDQAGGLWAMAAKIGSAAVGANDGLEENNASVNTNVTAGRTLPRRTAVASDVIKAQYACPGGGGTAQFLRRWLTVIPVRVS